MQDESGSFNYEPRLNLYLVSTLDLVLALARVSLIVSARNISTVILYRPDHNCTGRTIFARTVFAVTGPACNKDV